MARTKDALKILHRVTGRDTSLREMIAQDRLGLRVAEMILEKRIAAGLTQTQLAEIVGTTQSVIARLENSEYEGHSLRMLQRIAGALDGYLEVKIVSARGGSKSTRASQARRVSPKRSSRAKG